MNRLKITLAAAVFLLIAGLFLYITPLQRNVENTLYGFQCRIGGNEYEYENKITLYVKGVYKSYLFKNDTFEGIIEISGYDFTYELTPAPLEFSDGYSILLYHGNIDGKPVQNTIGMIFTESDFSSLLICVNEPNGDGTSGWNGENGLIICAPAENVVQALETAEKLTVESKLLSNIFKN